VLLGLASTHAVWPTLFDGQKRQAVRRGKEGRAERLPPQDPVNWTARPKDHAHAWSYGHVRWRPAGVQVWALEDDRQLCATEDGIPVRHLVLKYYPLRPIVRAAHGEAGEPGSFA